MKKFILIPDSFKGTLSSLQVCNIMERSIRSRFSDAEIVKIPVADGGEGSVDAFLLAVGGQKVEVEVTGPHFEKMRSFYGLIDEGQTAVIEMAACAGLPLVGTHRDPRITTTYGVGELILHAARQGVSKIILGLGGSATNDAGVGCMAALGIRFFNQAHQTFVPVGGTLSEINTIDVSSLNPLIKEIEFVTMCDIDNPLYGTEGAAYIFGPQKGATPEMVRFLDGNLKSLATVVETTLGFKEWDFKGAGAAGGMGYGAKVFLHSKIQMGIQTVLDITRFDQLIENADYIFTGEGRLDSQSMRGKVVIGVARRAKKVPAKLVAVVGQVTADPADLKREGIDHVVVTNYLNLPFEELKPRAELDMTTVVDDFVKSIS
jgi:glycerate kinase